MQKHLLRYPWIFAALITGILICIALILRMLILYHASPKALPSDVKFVKEAIFRAAF